MTVPPEDENPYHVQIQWLRAELAEAERQAAILEAVRSLPVVRQRPIALLRGV